MGRVSVGMAAILVAVAAFAAPGGAQEGPASSPDPSRRAATSVLDGQPDPARFILTFRDGTGPAAADADADAVADEAAAEVGAQANVARRLATGGAVVELSRRLAPEDASRFMDAVTRQASVAFVEPDLLARPTLIPDDPMWGQQWHYFEATGGINLPTALDTADGAGSVVAVLDTGRTLHPDLDANMVDGYDFIFDAATARDGNGRDSDETDQGDWETNNQCGFPARNSSWHGTHVAGTVAAVTGNGLGVAGVAPSAQILPVRVLGLCGGFISDIADAMVWASGGAVAGFPANATPADVINMSLGGGGACGATYQNAIDAAVGDGTAVVVAAGNSNVNASNSSPANCGSVITVASTNRSAGKADYSNFGSIVDLAAPGGDTSPTTANGVLSTLNTGTTVPASPGYALYQGTSMAAPHVAGVAALVLGEQSMTPAALETHLESTARSFPATCSQCGAGIVDAAAAVDDGGGGGTATGTIGFTDNRTSVREKPAGVDVVLTVSRSGGTGVATVDWATTGGTATAGVDYTSASGTLTFDPGSQSTTITVRVLGDAVSEGKETITVMLSNATSGISLSPTKSTINIRAN